MGQMSSDLLSLFSLAAKKKKKTIAYIKTQMSYYN